MYVLSMDNDVQVFFAFERFTQPLHKSFLVKPNGNKNFIRWRANIHCKTFLSNLYKCAYGVPWIDKNGHRLRVQNDLIQQYHSTKQCNHYKLFTYWRVCILYSHTYLQDHMQHDKNNPVRYQFHCE